MRLGHVAVVSRVVNAREIEIDHANWWGPGSRGGVTRGVAVIDVSENNDWTAVRVGLGNGDFGSVYPTHGFIYDRPDDGKIEVASETPAPVPPVNPPPADLRLRVQTVAGTDVTLLNGPISYDEVAEAPDDGAAVRTSRYYAAHHRSYRTWHGYAYAHRPLRFRG
jgi:hypothetical protein